MPPSEEWDRRVQEQLQILFQKFSAHCTVAERPGGLIREMEVRLGHPQDVTAVEASHIRVTELAKALLADLEMNRGAKAPYSRFRRQALQLLQALRDHETKERDLVYEINWRVNGVGD